MTRLVRLALLLSAALVASAACGGDENDRQARAASESPPVSATTLGSPSASTAGVSREQAAQRYLALVAPNNAAVDRFKKKCGADHDFMVDGGDSFKTVGQMLANLRECCATRAEADRQFAAGLRKAQWPAEARADVENLARSADAAAYSLDQAAKAQSMEEYLEAAETYPKDDRTADLVRAHLGLPPRT